MAFSQLGVSDVRVTRDSAELYVAWSAAAIGAVFQVYVDRRLSWYGSQQFCTIPIPVDAVGRNIWIEVGAVDMGELTHDYSRSLSGPVGLGSRVELSWYGGTCLDPTGTDDIEGYRIYMSAVPGGNVDYSKAICNVPAYPGGILTDGYGMGAFGQGGFGRAPSFYQLRSTPLSSGRWAFAVVPYDKAGNAQGSPQPISVIVEASPRPPAASDKGVRSTYTYSGAATRIATLNWLASPS